MILSDRITVDPLIMGGKPCVRHLNVTVASIVDLIANGMTPEEILVEYSYLDPEDISAAISWSPQTGQNSDTGESVLRKKPDPNHQRTLKILRSMTPQQKLAQVFKLNERTLKLFRIGLRRRFPGVSDNEFETIFLQMRSRWHNRTY